MNVDNLRDCIEHSPRLRFSCKIRTDSCLGGVAEAHVIESEYLVDYEHKTATIQTKTTSPGGKMEYVKTVYKDKEILEVTFDNLLDDQVRKNSTQDKMSDVEYDDLFSEKGLLRPLNCDFLQPEEVEISTPNTSAFKLLATPNDELEGWDMVSSASVSLCSEDTLKFTALASHTSRKNTQAMMVVVNETIVHMF